MLTSIWHIRPSNHSASRVDARSLTVVSTQSAEISRAYAIGTGDEGVRNALSINCLKCIVAPAACPESLMRRGKFCARTKNGHTHAIRASNEAYNRIIPYHLPLIVNAPSSAASRLRYIIFY